MNSSKREYFVIFDTNVLYQHYDKGADYSSFSFGSNYDDIINCINELDIYEKVTVAIPTVVWYELFQQIVESHDKQLNAIKSFAYKFKLPEVDII